MMDSRLRTNGLVACAGLVFAALGLAPLAASAQNAPSSFVAAPGVYKVLQENDQLRVVLATWQPGQRDVLHSHPANATYALTPCKWRVYGPDGKVQAEGERPQGSAGLQAPIPSHLFENAGTSECRILIVERK